MCDTLRRWRDHQQRELPWLAGPGLSALQRAGVTVSPDGDLRIVQRFLVGAEVQPQELLAAIERCEAVAEAVAGAPALPPDALGAMAAAAERFFDLLTAAYAQLHQPVRSGHRRNADDLMALWQRRLDAAADDLDERAKVLSGERAVAVGRPKPARGTRDRAGCALGFVALALVTAGWLVWAVMHGWPAQQVSFP